MKKQITFIHAADLHLDSPMVGFSHLPKEMFERLKESTFVALKRLIDAAIHYKVDFVIMAGDLYDNHDRSIRAQTRLIKEMERLEAFHIPVYVIHGNHDHLKGDWVHLDMPSNVYVFSDKVEVKSFSKENSVVHLYGYSYGMRHIKENRLNEFIKKEGADFHIGLLHGHREGSSDHSKYAPFHLKDLLQKKFDYWALGHIHKREILYDNPYIVYPGNIQGRNIKEFDEKGCYLVTLSQLETKLEFIDLADIVWKRIHINGENIKSFQELLNLCQKIMEENRLNGKGVVALVHLYHLNLTEKEITSIRNGELLYTLQEIEREQNSFVWPIQINWKQSSILDRKSLESESDFYVDLFQEADRIDEDLYESIGALYDHPGAVKFLPPSLNDNDKDDLQKEALQLLIRLLHD